MRDKLLHINFTRKFHRSPEISHVYLCEYSLSQYLDEKFSKVLNIVKLKPFYNVMSVICSLELKFNIMLTRDHLCFV